MEKTSSFIADTTEHYQIIKKIKINWNIITG